MLERPTEWVEGTLGYASFPPLFLPLLFLSGSERGWGLRQTQNGMRCNEEIDREGGRRTRMCRKPRRRPKKRGRRRQWHRFGVTAQKTRGVMGTLSFAKHLGFPSFVSWETEEPITEPDITLIMVVVIYPCFIGCDLGKFIANTLCCFLRGN